MILIVGVYKVFFCVELNGTIGSTWKQWELREIVNWAILLLILAVVAILLLILAVVAILLLVFAVV